ncbi:MAG: tetratricopeptide repeat protein [Caldilineales bacterium]|nr:tetratricopeptide repeat protein [Caldilineales bacterium]
MPRRVLKPALFVLLLAVAALLGACGNSAERLNKRGNDAYDQESYGEALVYYQRAQVESPDMAEAYYNAANTFYREGDYGSALQQLHRALSLTEDETILEGGLFNAGNSLYNSQNLMAAVDSYRQALLLDPTDMDAKYNLELALQQQQQDQQQQSGDSEDQQESQNQNESEQEQEQQPQEDQPEQPQEQQQQQQNQPQQGQSPQPGEKMTEEQAKQLLAAIGKNTETLQERLGMILQATGRPPVQDW